MDYLDKLIDILGLSDDECDDDFDTDLLPTDPLDRARHQLAAARTNFWEGPTGTFHACGNLFGCGYAEATVVVDPETNQVNLHIDSNLKVDSAHIASTRKLCRRLNQAFVIPGLSVEDDGQLIFAAIRPCDVDLDDLVKKGFCTIHRHAHMVAQINAGVAVWDVLSTVE